MKKLKRLLNNSLFVIVVFGLISLQFTNCNRTTSTSKDEYQGTIKIGHVVGVCMSCMVLAHYQKYFEEEGLKTELVWTPHPSDAFLMLNSGEIQTVHGPFTAFDNAVANGADAKIICGSGNEGLWVLAQPELGIKTMDDLVNYVKTNKKKLKVGTQRFNTLELTWYGLISDHSLSYKDFDMTFFNDHFTMAAAFSNKQLDLISHVEPYASQLEMNGAIRIGSSADTWGKDSPDCVVSVRSDFFNKYPGTLKKYIRAILKADKHIKENLSTIADTIYSTGFYKVDRDIYKCALPHQLPGVDLRIGVKGMDKAVHHLVDLGYIKKAPENVVDLSILQEVIEEQQTESKK